MKKVCANSVDLEFLCDSGDGLDDIISPARDAKRARSKKSYSHRKAIKKGGVATTVIAAMIGAEALEGAGATPVDGRAGDVDPDEFLDLARVFIPSAQAAGFNHNAASRFFTREHAEHDTTFGGFLTPDHSGSFSSGASFLRDSFSAQFTHEDFAHGHHSRAFSGAAEPFGSTFSHHSHGFFRRGADRFGADHDSHPGAALDNGRVGHEPELPSSSGHAGHNGVVSPTAPGAEPDPHSGHTPTGATSPSSSTGGSGSPAHSGHSTPGSTAGPQAPSVHAEHLAALNLAKVSAATHIAINSGAWSDPNSWANHQVPGDGARVVIPQGVSVNYDVQSKASLFTVRVDGALDFATDIDTHLKVDTFLVSPTGVLSIGSDNNPVDPNVKAVIEFADNGPIDVAWDPLLLSRGLIAFGQVEIHGEQKDPFLKVAIDPLAGDTALTLEAAPAGWRVGDKIVLAGTHLVSTKGIVPETVLNLPTEDEELVITAIHGNVISLDHALHYDHDTPRADLKTYVANYTRNVAFETENADSVPVTQRGHTMFMGSSIDVEYAQFLELGRTDKSIRAISDTAGVNVSGTNVQGRYALHLHHSGVDDPLHPAVITGNAVWGSPGWGVVQHDSNALLSDNAAYDVFGAAFVAESGNEIGRWGHNISIHSEGINHITKNGGDLLAGDLGRTGTGFWFQGRLVDAVDNVAVGVPSGAGFTYFHRGSTNFNIPIDPNVSNLSDSLRYLDQANTNFPNIGIFSGNETFATQTGLEIIKADPRQHHDLRSVIDNLTAWDVRTGVHLEYTGHYTLKDLDIIASQTPGVKNTVGVELSKNVFDVVINHADIDGFNIGVNQVKIGVNNYAQFAAQDKWEYVYIDTHIAGASSDFTNVTASDQHLTASDLAHGRLFFTPNAAATHIAQHNLIFDLSGVKTDSIGSVQSAADWDRDFIDNKSLRGSIEQNGYWTTSDGRRVAIVEEYFSDRATGDVTKIAQFVEIPQNYVLAAGRFTRVDPTYNGALNLNGKAPVAVDDAASVKQGHSVVIDLLANDSDPDGDAIKLDGIFSKYGHVVDNSDDTVTYFADPHFHGQDVFYYFVQDTNGDISKAQVTVTVDI